MAVAIARAESFWELPIIGRFFQPPGDEEAESSTEAAPSRVTASP